MNHRQWKKKFKKIHGRNPTAFEDKQLYFKHRAKDLCMTLPEFSRAVQTFENNLRHALINMFDNLCEAFKNIAANLSKEETE